MAVIELNDLTKNYGKNRGIKNVSFSVEEGEIFGFIGPNGSGKSTTIRTLLNYIYPSSGMAAIFGKDIVRDSLTIRRHTGYLPAEVYYYDDMRAGELLRYSQSFYGKNNNKRIAELAERLDLELNKKIEDLSSGNKKKVAIIQALAHEPKLLILDEPTGGLDPLMQNTFFRILREEKQKNTTIFLSSHILSEVQRICDRVAIIKEGEIIKVEVIEALIRNQFKKITIILANDQHQDLAIEGVIKQERLGNRVHLLYGGKIKALINNLKDLDIKDLFIEEPTLDEIFMHYYEK